MRKLTLLLFCCTVLWQPLKSQELSDPAERFYTAETVLEISTENEDYLLGIPVQVAADGDGNIYIADLRALDIKMFDPQGRFVKSIGRRGRGRGEFNRMNALHVDEDGRIVVADQFNSRVVTFDPEHRPSHTRVFKQTELLWPRQVIDFGDRYLFLSLLPFPAVLDGRDHQPGPTHLFHLAGRDLEGEISSFGRFDSLRYRAIGYRPPVGIVQPFNEESVLFVPTTYDGSIYHFYRDGRLIRYPGFFSSDDDIEIQSDNSVILNSRSVGLIRMETGEVVHFTLRRQENEMRFYLELFDEEMQLQSHGPLKGLGTHQEEVLQPMTWVEDYADGTFYMIDYRNEHSRVVAFKIAGL